MKIEARNLSELSQIKFCALSIAAANETAFIKSFDQMKKIFN